ncbi:hypothetical protein BJV78DRAFT_1282495 [Lactifluus subvellereus]|nr:hypothetical protein BJV78DRAFT_1282495 [Lactifluus subvellereus]
MSIPHGSTSVHPPIDTLARSLIASGAEAESSPYALFLALTCKFDLVPPEFVIIPTPSMATDDPEPPRLLATVVDPQRLPDTAALRSPREIGIV